MNKYEIKLQKRADLGKASTRNLRKQNMVPCEIYGATENLHCFGTYLDFEKGIITPHVYLFQLNVDGKKSQAIIKDVQYHPVTDKILHVDFFAVDDVTPVKVSLPVELTGTSVGVIRGGKLRLVKRKLNVKGALKHLPATVAVDISKLDVSQNIKVAQVQIEGVEFLEPKQTVIVNISASRTTAKTEGK
jgi:large subunit ribosomal protein L25